MRPHLSIFVSNVATTVDFYSKVFGRLQQQTNDYAIFDLKHLAFSFTVMFAPNAKLSRASHLGIEVDSEIDFLDWKKKHKRLVIPNPAVVCRELI